MNNDAGLRATEKHRTKKYVKILGCGIENKRTCLKQNKLDE